MENQPDSIYSISELNLAAKTLLETQLGKIWVIGEISNLSQPASGHCYFTLKDDDAQVRCALFRHAKRHVDFPIDDGQQVLACADVSLYAARGDYQLIVTRLQLAGVGALQLAFEKTKRALEAEGLFDLVHKKPLPESPSCIGVITSSTGAALRDILKVLKRRSPLTPVIIYPSLVQGAQAKDTLANAIESANQHACCDVLILARGGGSLEDLWAFNEPCVAHAIFNSQIPIITGIGHETDVTIADFVADQRAATPSAAAEMVSLDQTSILKNLNQLEVQLARVMQRILQQATLSLTHLKQRLRHPRDKIQDYTQRFDHIEQHLRLLMNQQIKEKQSQLNATAQQLNTLSPLSTLDRGYAIVRSDDGHTITSAQALHANRIIHVRLKDGEAICTVKDDATALV